MSSVGESGEPQSQEGDLTISQDVKPSDDGGGADQDDIVQTGLEPDPESEVDVQEEDSEKVKEALSRPPPVNSSYLPLPWKGRIGYACFLPFLFHLLCIWSTL